MDEIRFARKHLNPDNVRLVWLILERSALDFNEIYIKENYGTNIRTDFPYGLYEVILDDLVYADPFHWSTTK